MKGQTGARAHGDALTEGEAEIMSLWDGGMRDAARIAGLTGYGSNYVQQVVGRYAISDRSLSSFDKMVTAGTASLLAALHVFHPETRRGVHP